MCRELHAVFEAKTGFDEHVFLACLDDVAHRVTLVVLE
jgi:hypothetical protein